MKSLFSAIFLLLPLAANACWVEMPLSAVVKGSLLVIRGEIVSIAEGATQERALDIASIRVDEILKNETKESIPIGKNIFLAMPSVHRTVRSSADIRYTEGKNGYWILEYQGGHYCATYPKDFQPIENKAAVIEALLEAQK